MSGWEIDSVGYDYFVKFGCETTVAFTFACYKFQLSNENEEDAYPRFSPDSGLTTAYFFEAEDENGAKIISDTTAYD